MTEPKLVVLSCVIIAAVILNCSMVVMNMLTVTDTNERIKALEEYVESRQTESGLVEKTE